MWLERLNVCWMWWWWGQQKERQWNRRGVWKRDGREEDERRMAQPSVRPSYPTVHMVMTVSWWLIWRRQGPNTTATGSKPSQQPMCIRLWLMGGSIWTLCRPTDLTHSYIKNQGWLQRQTFSKVSHPEYLEKHWHCPSIRNWCRKIIILSNCAFLLVW